jgi:hypothetical protein
MHDALPPYTVRVSPRAKRVLLKIKPGHGLEVVVPRGFDKRRVPAVVRDRREWIAATMQRMREQAREAGAGADPFAGGWELPDTVCLLATGQEVRVAYREEQDERLRLAQENGGLLLRGPVGNAAACREALRAWLKREARTHLGELLHGLARHHGLAFAGLQIRRQKTRWGSCSMHGSISLNCKLMFLPPELARYVALHELCHTKHLNHSPAFWKMLQGLEPDARRLDRTLRAGWSYVPDWA